MKRLVGPVFEPWVYPSRGEHRERMGSVGDGGGTATSLDAGLGPTPPIHRRRRVRRRWVLLGVALVFVVVFTANLSEHLGGASGSSGPPGTCSTTVTLEGEGASFLNPLLSVWQDPFENASGGDRVDYDPAGAGAGITALTTRTVDFAVTDEPLTGGEYSALPGVVLTLPVSGSALAVVYDLPGLSTPIRLNGTVLAGIYLGSITTWDAAPVAALNPGLSLPSEPIIAAHRSDAAGTTYVLTDFLSRADAAWNATVGTGIQPSWPSTPDGKGISGNSGLLSYVSKTSGAIGYVDLPDTLASVGTQYAAVENPSGAFVRPNLTNTASAIGDIVRSTSFPPADASWSSVSFVDAPGTGDYPLVAITYVLVYRALDTGFAAGLAKSQVLAGWLDWAVGPGQSFSESLYYVTLPPAFVALDEAAIGTLTFHGSPLPACTFR